MTHALAGSLVHFDVAGPETQQLTRFYEGLFSWKVQPRGPGYSLVETPEGSPNGALVEQETPSLTVGIVVPDLESSLRRTVELGGQVVLPVTDNGWVKKARVTDPVGNPLTLIQG